MSLLRRCQFSSEYFAGYYVMVDLRSVKSISDIVGECKNNLIATLTTHNFEILIKMAKNTSFHIHQPKTLEEAYANPNNIIWICDHCGSALGDISS